MISFKISKAEHAVIKAIAERAVREAGRVRIDYEFRTALMDVTAVHANGCPLRLAELRDTDDVNFNHDVFGIRRHLNRSTGTLQDCFVPRFAATGEKR